MRGRRKRVRQRSRPPALPSLALGLLDVLFNVAGVFIFYLALKSAAATVGHAWPNADVLVVVQKEGVHLWYADPDASAKAVGLSEISGAIRQKAAAENRQITMVFAFAAEAIGAKRRLAERLQAEQSGADSSVALAVSFSWWPLSNDDAGGSKLLESWRSDRAMRSRRRS